MSGKGEYTYTLAETIEEIESWDKGGRMYGIDVAISAAYWLEHAPFSSEFKDREAGDDTFERPMSLNTTVMCLKAWLSDETPDLPDRTVYAALFWLRQVRAAS